MLWGNHQNYFNLDTDQTMQLQVENVFKLEIPWSREPNIFVTVVGRPIPGKARPLT